MSLNDSPTRFCRPASVVLSRVFCSIGFAWATVGCTDAVEVVDEPVPIDEISMVSYSDLSGTSGVGNTCEWVLHVDGSELPFDGFLWYGATYSDSVRMPSGCESVIGRPREANGIEYIFAFTPQEAGRYSFSVQNYIPGGPVALSLVTACSPAMSACLSIAEPPRMMETLEGNTTYFLSIENLPADSGGQTFQLIVEAVEE